ncbi:MAG: O-antigen ligase family protein [Candidatus Hodarchaeota archaeon]
MPPKIALLTCLVFVIWLLKVERRQNTEVSLVLWIPTFYFMIMSSRPIASWLSPGSSGGSIEEGSPLDRIILTCLVFIAIFILSRRKIEWNQMFKNNRWLILLYLILALSFFWSGYPYNSFKRWFKIIAIVFMGFMIISEQKPLQALESIFRRSAYILIPLSIVLIKYYPIYGMDYSSGGSPMGSGVATQKNGLGIICSFLVFFLICRVYFKWRTGELFRNRSNALADAIVIGIGLFLLFGGGKSYSATSVLVFIVGMILLILFHKYSTLTKFVGNNIKVVLIISIVLYLLLYSVLLPFITSSLGRREDLTDRDIIWTKVYKIAEEHPILGTGYGGFWGLDPRSYEDFNVSQAHNGYLDVYLQVGIVGLITLTFFIFEFSGNIRNTINYDYDWGIFGMCFLAMMLLHNYVEGDFIRSNCLWTITVFLTIVFSIYGFYPQVLKNPQNDTANNA